MKRTMVVAVVVMGLLTAAHLLAQRTVTHRVVFEVTTPDAALWESVLNNVENLQEALGLQTTQIEVVAHGRGLPLLMKTNTAMEERLRRIGSSGVVFAACENTMRRLNVKKEDLLPLATTVDSGVAEVVRKQDAGWSYLKGG